MKTKSLWLLVAVLLLSTAVLATGSIVSADPQNAGQIIHLPLIVSPSGPPEIELVPFATIPGGDTITGIVNAGDERLFVVERSGRIYIVQPDGTVLPDTFLDIRENVSTENWEEGLLGLVFHPDYPAVPDFYVTYTAGKDIKLSRFSLVPGNPQKADKKSEFVMMSIYKQGDKNYGDYRVHNAGDLQFGPDGYLYVAIGDGGPDPGHYSLKGDPDNRGQNNKELLANILRIDVNIDGNGLAPDCGGGGYEIPADNPLVDGEAGNCDEIWSFGLRNPYRFSFDRETGEMYIGEVGEDLREEIIYQPAGSGGGQNYGWACYEGTVKNESKDERRCPPDGSYIMPIYEYDQSENDCSVIGGFVYRGQKYPELAGRYVFGDFCTGRLWLLSRNGPQTWERSFADATGNFISTFGEDINGELYLGNRSMGSGTQIFKITVSD